ncbi:unnamed protein product [Acanthocheilonema viteae]|uniref:Uncharacterized protein n=1 Tax=Acanthocheilonema viteae TaxID=6277 RepID=A0A498S2V6_ACAVI|nr:unnamed protein product [Acanthocheilonema viteae]
MPHWTESESLTNLTPLSQERRSRSRNRMVVERTEVRQGCDSSINDLNNNGRYMQVEGRSVEVQYEPEVIGEQLHRKELRERYREHREEHQREYERQKSEWISSTGGERAGYPINEGYGNIMDSDEKRTEVSTYLNDFIVSNKYDDGDNINDINGSVGENDKEEGSSITDDNVWSKFGSLREFLSDYESIISSTNQAVQTSERTGEFDYRSESATYEETVSTTRYSDSGTPEYSLPVRITSYNSNPSTAIHQPGDSTITTETTAASRKVASDSKFAEDTIVVS